MEITVNNIVENLDNDLLLRRIGKRKVMQFLFKDIFKYWK
jgi:hypothetical protein